MNNNEGERERNWNLVSSDQRALPHSPSQISSGLQSSLAFWLRPCAARYNHQYMCLKASCTSDFPWKFSRPVLEHRWWNSASINAVQPARSKDRKMQFGFHPRAFFWLEDNPPHLSPWGDIEPRKHRNLCTNAGCWEAGGTKPAGSNTQTLPISFVMKMLFFCLCNLEAVMSNWGAKCFIYVFASRCPIFTGRQATAVINDN